MPYHYIDHTADVLFQATGKDLPEVFESCAAAVTEVMADLKEIGQDIAKEITLNDPSVEHLLLAFLEELIYLKDSAHLLFSSFTVRLRGPTLKATLRGTTLDNIKHQKVDIKAITLHEFYLRKEQDGWRAQVLVDI